MRPRDERFYRAPAPDRANRQAEWPNQQRDKRQNDGRENDEKRREQGEAGARADIGLSGYSRQDNADSDQRQTTKALRFIWVL